MRNKRLLLPVMLCVLVLSSCAQEASNGTLRLLLHLSDEKTLSINEMSLDVTRFSVTGSGPGGKTFAVDSTSSSVVLNGMPLGQWTVSSEGKNSKGRTVASGSSSFILEADSSPHSIELHTVEGNGSLQLKYEWDMDITQPVIEINIQSGPDLKNLYNRQVTPAEGTTSTTFTASSLPSGFYLVTSRLLNNGKVITGSSEAVRIANGEKTSGTITFRKNSSYSKDLLSLSLYQKGSKPISGYLTGTKDTIEAGKETTVTLETDCPLGFSDDCLLIWYLDGQEISRSIFTGADEKVTVNTTSGCHILNAVICDFDASSTGSVSWKFNSSAKGRKGIALYLNTVSSESSDLFLEKDTSVLPLPEGRFLLANPSSGTLRLCSIYSSSLSVWDKKSASDEGWTFLSNLRLCASDPDANNFVIVDGSKNINVLLYNRTSSTVEKAQHFDRTARYEGTYEPLRLSFSDIERTSVCPGPNGQASIVLSDSQLEYFLCLRTNGSSVTNVNTILKPDGMKSVSDLQTGQFSLACLSDTRSFQTCSWDRSGRTSFWLESSSYCEKPSMIRILNNDNLLVSDNSTLCWYVRGQGYWSLRSKIDCAPVLMEVSKDGQFIYMTTQDNRLVTYTSQDNMIYTIGYVQLPEKAVSMTLNGNDLLLLSENANLMICQISQGEQI